MTRRPWIVLLVVGCGGGRAIQSVPDAQTCPSDPQVALGTSCASVGATCLGDSTSCGGIRCERAIDGDQATWQAIATCPDAGVGDASPGSCSPLAADRAGTLTDPGSFVWTPSIVWDGSRYAVLWPQLESTTPALYALYIGFASADGTLAGTVHRVFPAGQYQDGAVLVVGDGELGVAYDAEPSNGMTVGTLVHFARLDKNGNLIDGSDVPMTNLYGPQLEIALAYSPALAQWAVIWTGQVPIGGQPGYVYDHLYLSRIDASGELLTPDDVQIDGSVSSMDAAIVWATDRWAAAIGEYDETTGHTVIVEIDPTTATVTKRILLEDNIQPIDMALATDGSRYGAAWMNINEADFHMNSTAFRIADVGGDALGTAPLVLGDDRSSGRPAIAFDGTFRIAESEEDATSGSLWVTRVSRDGTVIGTPGAAFDTPPTYDPRASIASDGCNDAIVWAKTQIVGTEEHDTIQLNVLAGSAGH